MEQDLTGIVETILYISGDEGLDTLRLAESLETNQSRIVSELKRLQQEYEEHGETLQIVQVGETFKLTTRPEFSLYVEKYAKPPERSVLSQAALESLAIVAYRQPVTRLDVEEVRGVKADRALHTLVNRGLVEEAGRVKGAGRAILYQTTTRFLDVFHLESLESLPKIDESASDEGEEQMDLFLSNYKEQLDDEKD
ncbi:SMC-Scp complex subunit ScpB [Geomicrobium sp. JCM 19039]|uniref:SMC-Scp complex subunit ScpB n=1 Tax=Geomicrobium sp. JCM 19039 TaxID=1460636 RepID=UPI00045F3EDB|nr:SMC-Scp complex subunit ScpB [Geomicrobium sp. JCM 19039]GAK12865.1 segregation and condensation protein B [Geomicrobium sp. JCM 19039]